MKQLRVTAHVDQDRAPPFYSLLADSPAIEETRVLEWNTTMEHRETVLFGILGDATRFAERAPDTQGIDAVELSAPGERWTYALVEVRPRSIPMFAALRDARTRTGLVVRKPIVYRDEDMSFRVVGDAATLQAGLDEAPDSFDVQIDQIEPFRGGPERAVAALSPRQREAVEVAAELGYYDRPRGATHDDIADELDCAPATASEHLQKAESKLVTATLDGFGASE